MSQRDARINDLLALDRLATCPKCFSYSTGDETHCLDCGCALYPSNYDRGSRLTSPDPGRLPQEGTMLHG